LRLSEDILADLKRKLKGQVSLADNVRRVAKQELKTAEVKTDILEELLSPLLTDLGDDTPVAHVRDARKALKLMGELLKDLKNAQRDLDKIK